MTLAPKLRWPRFTLRTLFVVVTVFCVWLGYELHWVQSRQKFLESESELRKERLPAKGMTIAVTDAGAPSARPKRAPWLLWAFGEKGYSTVFILAENQDEGNQIVEADHARVRQAKGLFPEANIMLVHFWEKDGVANAQSISMD